MRVFHIEVLRKISGPNWDEATGEGRRLNNEELYDPDCSRNTG
jgi:hypothetical protein